MKAHDANRGGTGLAVDLVNALHPSNGASPEIPERVTGVMDELERRGLLERLTLLPTPEASQAALARVHEDTHLKLLEGREQPHRWRSALTSAGASMAAVDAVMDGRVENAFCVARPPGHHACTAKDMGYCLLNNAALAAKHALTEHGLERVIIVDFDVHHGNGTQEIFYDDPRVLLFSVQRWDLFPPTGTSAEIGRGAGLGTTVNINLQRGVGNRTYNAVFDRLFLPLAEEFRPQLVLVSAGYDAHYLDDMGMMELTDEGYARITGMILEASRAWCDGRAVFFLEGGYLPKGLGRCVAATLEIMAGEREPKPKPVEETPQFEHAATNAAEFLKEHWAVFKKRHRNEEEEQ